MSHRQATYQAEWSLLIAGVAQARLEMHRIRHQLHRARKLVDESEQKEAIYQMAGDILQTVPRRWSRLENLLDRTAYALMILGAGNYRDRLPMDDRALVDDTDHQAKSLMAAQVASRYLGFSVQEVHAGAYSPLPSDLTTWLPGESPTQTEPEPVVKPQSDPQIGWPGGPCHLVQRINYRIRDPRLRKLMSDVVEYQGKLDKQLEQQLYKTISIPGPGTIQKIYLVPHAQHRMDQRTIVTQDISLTLKNWLQEWQLGRSLAGQTVRKSDLRQAQALYERWLSEVMSQQPIEYFDPKTHIFLVFQVNLDRNKMPNGAQIITSYWRGTSDPRPPGAGTCSL